MENENNPQETAELLIGKQYVELSDAMEEICVNCTVQASIEDMKKDFLAGLYAVREAVEDKGTTLTLQNTLLKLYLAMKIFIAIDSENGFPILKEFDDDINVIKALYKDVTNINKNGELSHFETSMTIESGLYILVALASGADALGEDSVIEIMEENKFNPHRYGEDRRDEYIKDHINDMEAIIKIREKE